MSEGRAALVAGRYDKASQCFEGAWNQEPTYAEAISLCGWAQLKLDLEDEEVQAEALENLETAVTLAGDQPLVHFRLGIGLAVVGQLGAAVNRLRHVAELAPDVEPFRQALGDVQTELAGLGSSSDQDLPSTSPAVRSWFDQVF